MGDSTAVRKSGAGANAKATGKKSGFNVDSGPYEAIVTGHVKGTRMGQLIVTIPDWGGTTTTLDGDSSNADEIVVSYCSPFYGTTAGTDSGTSPNTPQYAGQSYGMWLVPPDIGNKVLVVFAAGDMSRGYWIGCVYDSPSHHQVPGLARNVGGSSNTKAPPSTDGIGQYLNSSSNLPAMEYDITDPNAFTATGLTTTPRFPHEYQTMTLVGQGLDQDKIRGAISSSSLRESPSNVYGISTPGRSAVSANSSDPQAVTFRTGGHQFVMDDGADGTGQDPAGTDQLMRLRTSSGHQILMNDTENILYIASASGQQWMEFSADGSINVFGAAGFNLRTSGAMNFHSDSSINMCSPHISLTAIPALTLPKELSAGSALGVIPSISISSMGTLSTSSVLATSVKADGIVNVAGMGAVNVSASGALSLTGGALAQIAGGIVNVGSGESITSISGSLINLQGGAPAIPVPAIPAIPPIPQAFPDTQWAGSGWVAGATDLLSTCSVVPTHEPYTRTGAKNNVLAMGVGIASMVSNYTGATSAAVDAVSGAL